MNTLRDLAECFWCGACWLWADARDFFLMCVVLAAVSIWLGVFVAPSGAFVAGGVALLAMVTLACLVYGSHHR